MVQVISAMAHHGYLEQPGGEALVEYLVQQCALPPEVEVRAADPLRAVSCRLRWGAGSPGAAGPQPEHRWVGDCGLECMPRRGPGFQSGCTTSAAGPKGGGQTGPWLSVGFSVSSDRADPVPCGGGRADRGGWAGSRGAAAPCSGVRSPLGAGTGRLPRGTCSPHSFGCRGFDYELLIPRQHFEAEGSSGI